MKVVHENLIDIPSFAELTIDPTRESTICASPTHRTRATTVASSAASKPREPATTSISSITTWRSWHHPSRHLWLREASSLPPRRRNKSWRAAASVDRPIPQSRKLLFQFRFSKFSPRDRTRKLTSHPVTFNFAQMVSWRKPGSSAGHSKSWRLEGSPNDQHADHHADQRRRRRKV